MRILLCMLFVIMLSACSTPKNIQERSDTTEQWETTERNVYEKELQASIGRAVRESMEELKKRISDFNMEYSRTSYSPPDSAGKQYPTQVETGKLNNKTEESSQSNRQTEEQYQAIVSHLSQFSRIIDSMENKSARAELEYKEKLSLYQSALVFLGGLFLVYIIVTVYIKLKKP